MKHILALLCSVTAHQMKELSCRSTRNYMARNNTGNGFKCMQILLIVFVAELIIIACLLYKSVWRWVWNLVWFVCWSGQMWTATSAWGTLYLDASALWLQCCSTVHGDNTEEPYSAIMQYSWWGVSRAVKHSRVVRRPSNPLSGSSCCLGLLPSPNPILLPKHCLFSFPAHPLFPLLPLTQSLMFNHNLNGCLGCSCGDSNSRALVSGYKLGNIF